jgi:hypothetical protein
MRLELPESSIDAVLRFLVSPWRRDATRRSALPDEFDLPMISFRIGFLGVHWHSKRGRYVSAPNDVMGTA